MFPSSIQRHLQGFLAGLSVFCLSYSGTVFADGVPEKKPDGLKEICFNLLCHYKDRGSREAGYRECRSASVFKKWVYSDGRELRDTSAYPLNPEFEVECDHLLIFNNSALRQTDELGTRIQGGLGPYPATLLPRNALREGHRYLPSSLELEGQQLHGYCYIYSTTSEQ